MLSKLNSFQSYLIGLLQGDGNMYASSRNRGKMTYEISLRDKDIIYKLRNILCKEFSIHIKKRITDTNFKKGYKSIRFTIHDLKFRQWLNKYVPYGKKSQIVKPPKKIIIKDYIRGLTDADGSLGITKSGRCFWSLCTKSQAIKEFILKHINKMLYLDKQINRNKRDNIYNIMLCDETAMKYTNFLYSNAKIFIDRKYKEYLKIQKWQRTTPKINFKRKRWLNSEDEIIFSGKYTIDDLCKMFERTVKSVRIRIWRLNRISNK